LVAVAGGGEAVVCPAACPAFFFSKRRTSTTGIAILPSPALVMVMKVVSREIISPVTLAPLRRCSVTVSARHALTRWNATKTSQPPAMTQPGLRFR